MIYAKKFKTKLKVNAHKMHTIAPGIVQEGDILRWIDKMWIEFLEQQIIPTQRKEKKSDKTAKA